MTPHLLNLGTFVTVALILVSPLIAADPSPSQDGKWEAPVPLVDLSGHKSQMQNFAERPCTVVLFLSSRCPITEKALADVDALYRKYRVKNALYVGIVPSKDESDEKLKTFVERRGIIFPLYRDPDGSVTRRFGAKASLEAFVLDRQGKQVYRGGIDSDAGRAALEQVIVALLAKSEVKVKSVAAKGTPLDQTLPPIERDDPYGRISFAAEMIFEKIPRASASHCSTLVEAANKDLLCLWYGGAYESSNDQVLFLSRRKPGQREWSVPQVVVENPDQPPGNAILFVDHQERLWLVWCRMESTRPIRRGSGWNRCRLMYRISGDHGESWSEDKPLVEDDLWAVPRNVPLHLKSGRLVLPVEATVERAEGSIFLLTDDDGKTWQRSHFIPGGSQPTLAERGDGTLVAYLRQAPRILQLESKDQGLTWTQPQRTELANPDAGIAMTRLANGHWLMVFNDTPTQRTPLSITRSLDEGQTWEKPLHLESNPGEYSYPCIIQTADGKIQLTYTFRRYAIKHTELNEDWISHLTRPN